MKLAAPILAALAACCTACSGASSAAAPPRVPGPQPPGVSGTIPFDHHILVDQFGYRPGDPKVAVIRDPQLGFDSADHFTPGPGYEVRRTSDGVAVFAGAPVPWNKGATEASSGDRGWWFDFSALTSPGSYFIVDVQHRVRSATFRIDPLVYRDILKAAMKMYFYQRSGFAKQPPFADACWTDDPAYIGPQQDLEARDVTDRDNAAKVRNLAGGWFDAGDTNKYVTYAMQPVHQLLTAYQTSPAAFGDDFAIPESGNGVPDVLDEVKWEIDWLKRMQYPDGSAALKVGEIVDATASPPSSDHHPRFYIPACTSATIAVAGMFAHAAYVYARLPPLAAQSLELRARAVAAWNNYRSAPAQQAHCDSGAVKAGIADLSPTDQDAAAVVAAVYLFAITGDAPYDQYVHAHYRETRPYRDIGWTRYQPEQGDALLFYATLSDADPALRSTLLADKSADVKAGNQVYGFHADDDLYRAFLHDAQYHWGSNGPRANYGSSNLDVVDHHLDGGDRSGYETRALEILHYLHGVNPLGIVYLTNMYRYGATASANEIYHTWYWHGSRWSDALTSACGPPPGYLPGGPNASAVANGVPATLVPPAGQPPQKAYRDWNTGWPESAWTITEPGIYFQSAYVRLLSHFAH